MESNSASGIAPLGRLFCMMIGPAILFVLAITIARDGGGWFTVKDIICLVVLGGLIAGRTVEFRGGDPRTAAGEPATKAHLHRYITATLTVGLGVWTIANVIGNR